MSQSFPFTRRRFLAGSAATLMLSACGGGSTGASSGNGNPTGNPLPDSSEPGPMMPRGLHVSLGEDSRSSRSLTWFTDGVDAPASRLEWDVVEETMSADDIAFKVFAHTVEASTDATPGVEAFTHRATVTGIDPERPLRYRVGSDEGGWSSVYVVPPSPAEQWSFIHFGDHGVGELAQMVTDAVMRTPSDLLLLAGDLSYANGDQPIWDLWFDQMQPLMSQRITMTAPGNHEQKDFGGDTFKNRFTHPGKPLGDLLGTGSPGSSYYSFDYNRVHFLVTTAGALINDGTLIEEILNIEADLAQAALRRGLPRLARRLVAPLHAADPRDVGLLHILALAAEAAGDAEAGCSVHLVTPELDDGPVLGQTEVRIAPDDTPESLAARVLVEEHRLYPAVLRQFCTQFRRV